MTRWYIDRAPERGILKVNLRNLLSPASFAGRGDLRVSGCSADLARIEPGDVYVSIREEAIPPLDELSLAIERGAVGIVTETPGEALDPSRIVVPDAGEAYAEICNALSNRPFDALRTFAISGPIGGSPATAFLRAVLGCSGARCSTYIEDCWTDHSGNATSLGRPDARAFASIASESRRLGSDAAILELPESVLNAPRLAVSSFGIEAALLIPIPTDSGDDPDRRAYLAKLARAVKPGGTVVLDADDPDAPLLEAVNLEAGAVTYGFGESADLRGEIISTDARGTTLRLVGLGLDERVRLRVLGRPAVRAALAAAAVALARGFLVEEIIEGLESIERLPGYLEAVRENSSIDARVDLSESPREIAEALETLRGLSRGALICVLGAKGRTSLEFRKRLAEAAEAGSDRLVITSDDPREDDPFRIAHEMLAGLRRPDLATIELDRASAIRGAIGSASPGDVVLIAGKGPRGYQILSERARPFDDREIAENALKSRFAETSLAYA